MNMPEQPSRLERPKEHRKWAIAVANELTREYVADYNKFIRTSLTVARRYRDDNLREAKEDAMKKLGRGYAKIIEKHLKEYKDAMNEDIDRVYKEAIEKRNNLSKEYRAKILKSLGY